ncbi:hypothetical protein [Glutamicibacter ardleyensis]|uniref:hypothetical protein n=1 Tax=Glutamicibacter ardleyensis TaxID=225894 RepID=UPI003FD226CD
MSALACSNIAPIALAFAIRTFSTNWPGFWISMTLAVLGVVSTFYFFFRRFPPGDTSSPMITHVQALGGEASAYIASFVLPLAMLQDPTPQDMFVAAFCVSVYLLIAIRTNLILVNPIFYMLGYKLWRVHSKDIPGGSAILIGKNDPRAGEEISVLGQNSVLLEEKGIA